MDGNRPHRADRPSWIAAEKSWATLRKTEPERTVKESQTPTGTEPKVAVDVVVVVVDDDDVDDDDDDDEQWQIIYCSVYVLLNVRIKITFSSLLQKIDLVSHKLWTHSKRCKRLIVQFPAAAADAVVVVTDDATMTSLTVACCWVLVFRHLVLLAFLLLWTSSRAGQRRWAAWPKFYILNYF